MADLRTARLALAGLLAQRTGVAVIPHPPRQTAHQRTIFFGAMSGSRETQDGGEMATVPVYVVVPSNTDDQYDILDEFIDGGLSIIDIIDTEPNVATGVAASVSGDWSIDLVDIGGVSYLAATFTVMLRY